MTGVLAIGVGCRRDCPAEAIVALVRRARDHVGASRPARLYSIRDKDGEPGLHGAAAALGLDLAFLSRDRLAEAAPRIATPSAAAQARFGVPSVSEAAALAGAGPGARLLLPRIAANGATCAVAEPAEER